MHRVRRVLRATFFGLAGGLIGSWLHQQLLLEVLSGSLSTEQRYIHLAQLGGLIGAMIAFLPVLADRWEQEAGRRALLVGLTGALLGGLGGALALPFAEWVHRWLEGGVIGRVAAWGILGLAVGAAVGLRSGFRLWRGLAGGCLGGGVAGAFLEQLLSSRQTHADSGVIALLIVGASISLCATLFVNVLSQAWLEGLPGSKVEGQIYHLGKFLEPAEAILGSAKSGSVFVWIPDADDLHAGISLHRTGARLRLLSEKQGLRVDGVQVTEHSLHEGQVIEVGSARLRYHERRKLGSAA